MSGTRVICPACGCHMETVPGTDLGRVDCPECGARFDVRDQMASAAKPTNPVRRPVAPTRVAARQNAWLAPALVGAAVGAVAAALVTVACRPMNQPAAAPAPTVADEPWDHVHRSELMSLKGAGDACAFRGELRVAYDNYNRLLTLAVEHGITDPSLAQVVSAARLAGDRVAAAMMTAPVAGVTGEPAPRTATTVPIATANASIENADRFLPFGGTPARDPQLTATAPAVATAAAPAKADPVAAQSYSSPADRAPPVANPPPPPRLHAYALPDALTDAQIGEAIDRGARFLAGRFVNGVIVTGLEQRPVVVRAQADPLPTRAVPPGADDSDLTGGSDLGALPTVKPPPAVNRRGEFPTGQPWVSAYSTPGIDALCVYALMHAGQATQMKGLAVGDPFTERALDQLKGLRLGYTYHRSLRAAALAAYGRDQDRATLEDDVAWLVAACRGGGYTYTMPKAGASDFGWDNSNSQYGLLGVWSGAQAGIAVPAAYWRAVEQHWNGCADPKGRGVWGYSGEGATLTMTCAGIVSLLVARDYLDTSALLATTADRPSPNPNVDAGLARLDVGDNCMNGLFHPDDVSAMGGVGYGLYGLERVGLASGFKYFGSHDWYAELARHLVNEQRADGSWTAGSVAQAEINTAYALLFLARGRHPILFNKLRYPGNWNDRPHDVAHLARFASRQLERPLNWQVVNLRRTWFDWSDSPVLYISGAAPPTLSDDDVVAIRNFALAGGLILTHADGGSPAFTAWVRQFCRAAFPKYELTKVPKAHPLNTVLYRLADPPPLQVLNNGSRILLVHCPVDVAGGWQLDWSDEKRADFQLGANVFVYAAGKTDYRNRLTSNYIPIWPGDPTVTRTVGRLRFAGEWDPEPYAWTRFARHFTWETHAGLDVQTIDLKRLQPGQVPAAFLTGTVRQDFTAAEAAAARAYVEAGGVLVIDACGGQESFAKGVRTTLLPAAFPGVPVVPLTPDHPIFVASRPFADDLTKLPLRPFASEQLGTHDVSIEGLRFGRGWVVFSHLDLTTGLLGTSSWGILGYDPASAQALVKNVVLWAEARAGPAR